MNMRYKVVKAIQEVTGCSMQEAISMLKTERNAVALHVSKYGTTYALCDDGILWNENRGKWVQITPSIPQPFDAEGNIQP